MLRSVKIVVWAVLPANDSASPDCYTSLTNVLPHINTDVELLYHRLTLRLLQVPPKIGHHFGQNRQLFLCRLFHLGIDLSAFRIERNKRVLVGRQHVKELELIEPYASSPLLALTWVFRKFVQRGLPPVLVVLQEQLVELVRLADHEKQLAAQLRAVIRKRDADVGHVEREEEMVVGRVLGHARIVHGELEDQSAEGVRHERNAVDGAVHLLLQPRHFDQHLVHHGVCEEVEALGGVGVAGLDEDALHVGVGERDQILHLLHVKRIGLESVKDENDMQRLVGDSLPETVLAARQDRVVLPSAGRIDAVPVFRRDARGRLLRLGAEHFAEERHVCVDVDGLLELGEILANEPT